MSSRLPIQRNSSPFCSSYALTHRSRQQILVPQVQVLMQADTNFPKVRRMLLCLAPLNLIHFWQTSTLLRGPIALATLSLPETDPQILERWRCAYEVHLGKYVYIYMYISERRILVSNFSVTCNSLCEFYTLDWFLHV